MAQIDPHVDDRPTVYCPHCWRRTANVQEYEAPTVVFLVLYVAWNTDVVAGCPRCVRMQLWQRLAFSIPLANLAFPFVAPILLSLIWSSHARKRAGIPDQYLHWADLKPTLVKEPRSPEAPVGRVLLVLFILALVAVMVFFVLPWLGRPRD